MAGVRAGRRAFANAPAHPPANGNGYVDSNVHVYPYFNAHADFHSLTHRHIYLHPYTPLTYIRARAAHSYFYASSTHGYASTDGYPHA
jgi:hypothetical protein